MTRWIILLAVLTLGLSYNTRAQQKVTWETFADVTWADRWSDELSQFYYYPTFGEKLQELDGKEIMLKGYVIPLDLNGGVYILSKFPNASCFFCTGDGPETVAEIRLAPGHPEYQMDDVVMFSGKLILNRENYYELNYIIDNAREYAD